MNKTLLVFVVLLLLTFRGFASHVIGADLRYEFNGTNYTIYLSVNSDCAGAGVPSTQAVNILSLSTSTNTNLTLTQASQTMTPACPTAPTTCQNPSALIMGFKTTIYTGSVTLAQANDWVISYTVSARAPLYNLNNSTGSNLYIEARLDNSTSINSNPIVSGHISYLGKANSPLNIPLQPADPEGDSIAYELITPMHSATQNCMWNGPMYTPANPLGASGVCTVNNATKVLTLQSANVGTYAIAIKVKEYRNNTLIASHIKDLSYFVSTPPNPITLPAPPANMTMYTCPGQINSVTLNFTDAGSDSLTINATTPTMSGWSFTKAYTSGPGVGSVNLSWTTPASLNPATLPYFFVNISATDNACPKSVMNYVFIVRTQQCASDSVWPGDANGDFTVNMYDPLAIAIAMGKTGATRVSPTTSWVPQFCMPWANVFVTNNVNMKHADCDGNGTVASADLGAVTANYGLSHPKGEYHNKTTGAPPLYLDMTGITLTPGSTVAIPIKLGDATTPMTSIYGLATRITVNGITMNSASVTTATTWLGNGSNTINFVKGFPAKVEWAHVRNDHNEVNGNGTIGTLNFTVPTNATPGATVTFSFGSTKVIDKDGLEITAFDEQDANATIPTHVNDLVNDGFFASIIPNPSHNTARLRLMLSGATMVDVRVTDIAGKLVWQHSDGHETGESSIDLPSTIAPGMYMVTVANGNEPITQQLKWIKQ